ncbi:hypothetical protein GCM10022221_67710 [Actinocorallia aurea]
MLKRRTCRVPGCGEPLKNRVSLMYGVGSTCRTRMTDDQLAEALVLTRQENDPNYVPPPKLATAAARATNRAARATVSAALAEVTCHHGGTPGRCGQCTQEEDPAYGVRLVIAEIQDERDAAIDARLSAWIDANPDHPAVGRAIRNLNASTNRRRTSWDARAAAATASGGRSARSRQRPAWA